MITLSGDTDRNILAGPKADISRTLNDHALKAHKSRSHPLHLRRKASRRGEMDVQILRARIGELPFDSLFQPDALDHFPAGHHCLVQRHRAIIKNWADAIPQLAGK